MQVILVFGICGCLRCDEIVNIKVNDVEDLGDKYLVSINANKNDYAGQFIIGNLFYDKVKSYILLRPSDYFSDRFFIKYSNGKCSQQVIGKHKIGSVPEEIASFLQLEQPKRYTGHCFRRTSATLLSNSGANMQMVKQLGRWRSDLIAQGYIENSMHNRQMIYEGVIQKGDQVTNKSVVQNTTTNTDIQVTDPKPSTSAQVISQKKDECNYEIAWSDFDDEFNLDPISSK